MFWVIIVCGLLAFLAAMVEDDLGRSFRRFLMAVGLTIVIMVGMIRSTDVPAEEFKVLSIVRGNDEIHVMHETKNKPVTRSSELAKFVNAKDEDITVYRMKTRALATTIFSTYELKIKENNKEE